MTCSSSGDKGRGQVNENKEAALGRAAGYPVFQGGKEWRKVLSTWEEVKGQLQEKKWNKLAVGIQLFVNYKANVW